MHKHGGDIYSYKNKTDYSANINFLGMPESVRLAAMDAVNQSEHYPDVECRNLRAAIAKREGISAERIFCGNGAADVIFSLVLAKKPKCALLPVPSFYEYQQALNSVGCQITTYALTEKNGFVLTEDFLSHITPQVDMIFICNPNNPTGELVDPQLMQKILKTCERTGTLLVVDECFNDFLEDPNTHTLMPELERSEQLFVLKAFTKMYAIPGLRVGYGMCSNGALLDKMERVSQPWRVSVPAQAAGCAAAKEVEFAETSRREVTRLREKMITAMTDMGYQIYGSRANYIFFEGEHHLWDQMEARGFLIRDCSNYQGLHLGFYRVAVRSEEENIAFLQALKEIHEGG
jgi:threonine-phosphate decarboxylase